mmetsp:Transcript_11376/g.11692  ORF Transcript_11376/g.11692 Transcript_11376/m.11692 type:complete len:344 (-) Transcript_11376:29-1060(-)
MKKLDLDEKKDFSVLEFKKITLDNIWEKWLIFRSNKTKEWSLELKKILPPYFDTSTNKINDFSMRENVLFPPCPQEFLEVLLNGILLRNELGLYRSKFYFYKELQQLLIEYLKLFYYRIDAIIDIFQTITKHSLSKEKFPKIVVKCSNCDFFVFINVQCNLCQNEFYCDETCRKIHYEVHKPGCQKSLEAIPKIYEPLRIEVHISSDSLGEEIVIYSEHHMKYSKMMKGKVLLAFLFKSLRKDRWFRNNKYSMEEDIDNDYICIRRGIDVDIDVTNYDNKDFIHKISIKNLEVYFEDEFRDILRLSVVQELKFNFYKLGALLVDIVKETHPGMFKYVFIFHFP